MNVRTTILDLAMALYEEAVALVGEGREADALAAAAMTELLHKASSERVRSLSSSPEPSRARFDRSLRASA